MNKIVLETNNVSKIYANTNVLENISITLEAGKIYALIGRNGAGKSTLMRLITGLANPNSGSITLFHNKNKKNIHLERKRIGSMIEAPSIHMNLTAKENLRMHRMMRGVPNVDMEEELLALVGIPNTNKKKVKHFSLGMKQRLGIAITLLNNPEFLILDEPINGLDPIGVIDIRNLLIKLSKEKNMTILLSSHNLPELYQIANEYIIINHGKIVKTLSNDKLEEQCKHYLRIETTEPEKLVTILQRELHTNHFKVMPNNSIKLFDFINEKEKVANILSQNRIVITNLSREGETLEEYFVSLVGGEDNG